MKHLEFQKLILNYLNDVVISPFPHKFCLTGEWPGIITACLLVDPLPVKNRDSYCLPFRVITTSLFLS